MINLLPVEEKEKIKNLYRARLLVVSLAASCVAILIVGVFLLPSLFLAGVRARETAERAELTKKSISIIEAKHAEEEIKRTAERLAVAARSEDSSDALSRFIGVVVRRRTSGVDISGFYSQKTEGGRYGVNKLLISGTARDRNALLAFAAALRSEPVFSRVELPVSNLVKNEDISFSVVAFLGKREER